MLVKPIGERRSVEESARNAHTEFSSGRLGSGDSRETL